MPKKRAKNRRKTRAGARRGRSYLSRILRFFLKLGVLLALFAAVGLIYLDVQVREKFEGKRWALPAKVYARPLELYPGQALTPSDLQHELRGLGYQFVSTASRPGMAEMAGGRVLVHTRGFDFPDGVEPSRRLMLEFSSGQLVRMRDQLAGGDLSLTRLEPILIGGIYPRSNEDRDLIRLEDAPPYLIEALIAVEDRAYYSHYGVSVKGISRAMLVNLRAGRFVQGGSTLTQQLIKNFYLTSERTLSRKLLELPMALVLDLRYDKDEILEAYLNEVYLGQQGTRAIHGFGLASEFYFGQPITELELHQVALLVALVKGPSFYDPRRNQQRAVNRRNLVLQMLLDQKAISLAQYERSIAQPLGVVQIGSLHKGAYPAYLDLVKRQLRESYRDEDLSSEGLRVFTALDPLVQHRADQSVVKTLQALETQHGDRARNLQSGMVVVDPQTGEVLAIVGGRDTRYQGFNRGLDAIRPIGSLIKPAVYLAALEKGYTLSSILRDEPVSIRLQHGQQWEPQNFDRKAHGRVPLYRALAQSYNLSTVHLGMDVGLPAVINVMRRLGVTSEIQSLPSLLLGAKAMAPLEVAEMYQTLAANGFRVPLRAIRMVTTADGEELSRYPFTLRQQVDSRHVHLIQYALQQAGREGTARSAYQQLPDNLNFAGKTGTTNDQRDSWFAGYTGNRLAVVWVGRDDNERLPFTGSGGALRVWTEFMREEKPQPLQGGRSESIELAWIDEATGYRSHPSCQGARQLPFIVGTLPAQSVDCGQGRVALPPQQQQRSDAGPVDWFINLFR